MKKNTINKIYNIKNDNNLYQLIIDINDTEIKFTINILNNSIDYYFMTKIDSLELIKNLGLMCSTALT